MQSRRIIATSLIVVLGVAPFAYAAQEPQLTASPICEAPGVNPRVTTHLSGPLHSPRVYFRSGTTGPEYYVEMQKGSGDLWWAVLPAIATSTSAITYRVAAQDANNKWVSGASVTVNSTATCPTTSMTSTDKAAADNIVLGLTSAGESATPVGFLCQGVKSIITADGQLRPAEECRMALAKAGAAAGTVAATTAGTTATVGGMSAATLAALAIGGAVAGYAIYHNTNKSNNNVSPSRP